MNLPVIMIIAFGFWYGAAWLMDRKKNKRETKYPSATKKELDFLLGMEPDQRRN